MNYRPEIDGLRALAVIPVILFHAGFELFSGGFVGVDVFFVISGYLITTILIEDMENNRFNILNFYERRARRILPALFFVMLVCVPFAWMWMLPSQMKDFSQSLVAVSLFASNILFWKEGGYFDSAVEEKPLLHTWSLAVEEQYYLLFPIFLFVVWRFGKKRVFWMIVVFAAASLMLSEWGWRHKTNANFYLAPTRAWELLAGSICAFIVQTRGIEKNNLLALIGLVLIVFSIFVFNESTPFPSIYALVPVIGAMFLVLFAHAETLVAKLLSTKILVGIGLISYSAYLWHQPLFAFVRIRTTESPSTLVASILSIVSVLLAYFTWRFIEKPSRNVNFISRKMIFRYSSACLLTFIAFGYMSPKLSEIFLYENSVIEQNKVSESSDVYVWARKDQLRLMKFGVQNHKVLVIGDSNSGDLINALEFIFDEKNVSLSSLTIHAGCGSVYVSPNRFQQFIEPAREEYCRISDTLHSERSKKLMQDASVVIFAASWSQWQVSFLAETKNRLIEEFGDKFWWFGNKHIAFPTERQRVDLGGSLDKFYPAIIEKQLINKSMHDILGKNFINPYDLICDFSLCRIVNTNGELLIYDGIHLTRKGAEYLGEKLSLLKPNLLASWFDNESVLRPSNTGEH